MSESASATVADVRAEGARLAIFCPQCRRLRYLPIHRYEAAESLRDLQERLKCIRCLEPNVEVRIMRRDPRTGYWPAESV